MSYPPYRVMRKTTSEFPCILPDGWSSARINYRFSVTLGKMLDAGRAPKPGDESLPYIRAANIQDNGLAVDDINEMPFTPSEQKVLSLRAGDLLVVEGGAVGTNHYLREDLPGWAFQKTVNRVRSRGEDSPRFLGYVITTYRDLGLIDMISNKSTIAHLTAEKLQALRVPIAPPEDQRVIADFLDRETAKIDELIAKQNALIELLAERRKAVITRAVSPGSDIAVASQGDWALVPLKRVIQGWSSGTSVNAADTPAVLGEVGVLKTSCVSTGQFDPGQNKVVLPEELNRVTGPVRGNTVIVNRANTPLLVGSAGLVRETPTNLFLSDKLWQIEFSGATPSFIFYWTLTELYRSQLCAIRVGTSASMQNISFEDFRTLLVALPPMAEQDRIAQHLDGQVATIDALIQKARDFIALAYERRSALITAAVTGTIDVRELVS